MNLSSRQRRIIESKVGISDNDLTNLLHHVEDAQKALHGLMNRIGQADKDIAVLASSLGDIKELAEQLSGKLSPVERNEL